MKSKTKLYGKVVISEEEWEENYPIKLEYFSTKKETKENKMYGIGVTKTCIKEKEVDIEHKEFNNILEDETKVKELLQILLRNRVTPVGLNDVLEEIVEV